MKGNNYPGNFNQDQTSVPLGLDLENFVQNANANNVQPQAPQGAVSQQNDLPIITEVLQQNPNFKTIIGNRIRGLKSISSIWTQGNRNEAYNALSVMNDLTLANDVLNYALIKTDLTRINLRSDDAIIILPMVLNLVNATIETYFKNGIKAAMIIYRLFSEVIINTKGLCPIGGGVDLNREAKIRKYDAIIYYFKQIRGSGGFIKHLASRENDDDLNLAQFSGELDYFLRRCDSFN